jgi:RHS repeat-associated protein
VAAGTVREYIWLPETEIAPTREANAQVDRPLAVVNAVGTASVAIWNVSVDHLNRPVLMTNSLKGPVWTAVWQPWGGAHSIAGTGVLDARFPGQWYQTETGLHYNWHRSYDPAVGRYTQPDPLGFVDGPSVYGYGGGRPLIIPDYTGLQAYTNQIPSVVPGGPWEPRTGARPGSFQGPKQPKGPRAVCEYVPDGKNGGPPSAPNAYWKVQVPGQAGWQRYDLAGKPIAPSQAHP